MSSIHSADRGSIFGYLLKQQKRATARSEPANATVVHKMYTERALRCVLNYDFIQTSLLR